VSGGQAVEKDAYIRVASAGNTFVADPDGSRSAAISLGLRDLPPAFVHEIIRQFAPLSGPLFLSHFHGEFPTVCEPGKSPFKAI
jgi:hypothetical protein